MTLHLRYFVNLLIFILLLIPTITFAATFTVTNLNDSGAGSFRQAILDSENGNSPTIDVIDFTPGLTGVIPTDGDPGNNVFSAPFFITENLTIIGPGASVITIDAQMELPDFVFNLDSGMPIISISGLRLINATGSEGPCISTDGNDEVDLTLDSVVFEDNVAGDQGCINFDGTLAILNSDFINNTAEDEFGGVIFTSTDATITEITNCRFIGNTAETSGGAIRNQGNILAINNSTFRGNTAINGDGGAIDNFRGVISAINHSTFSNNTAGDNGGAIYINNLPPSEITEIFNSTFSGNRATNESGGAIFSESGEVTNISFTTIANNTAGDEGGGLYEDDGEIEVRNSIVAFNTAAGGGPNCNTDLITDPSETNNYSDDMSCGFSTTLMMPGELDPLADNGGPTETVALLSGSALDGASADCDTITNLTVPITSDQRFFPRPFPVMGLCDSGAFEAQPIGTLTVEKVTLPPGLANFEFFGTNFQFGCGMLGTFFLDDMGMESCPLLLGSYMVEEIVPSGFALNIDCSGASSFSVMNNILTVDLVDGEDVLCTFTNTQTFLLTANKIGDGDGTVTADMGTIDCAPGCTTDSDSYGFGSMVTLTAIADAMSIFNGWTGDCASAMMSPTATVTMDQARTCTAEFLLNPVILDVEIQGNGTCAVTSEPSVIDCPGDCTETFPSSGTTVTLTAMPDFVSEFVDWTGDCSGTDPETMITVNQDSTCIATCILREFVLNPVFPALDDNINSITSEVATPGGRVAFIWGMQLGSFTIGGQICRGTNLGINAPNLLAIARANDFGVSTYIFYIPTFNDLQFEVQLQAVDIETCRTSNVVPQIIRKDESG